MVSCYEFEPHGGRNTAIVAQSCLSSLVSHRFAVTMSGEWVSGEVSLDDVKEVVENLLLYPSDVHSFHEGQPGPLTLADLPTLDFPTSGVVKCFMDWVPEVPGNIPYAQIKECLQSKAYKELPAPFGLSQDVATPFKLDMAILPQQNGNHTVVKMFHLSKLVKVKAADAMCYGKPYMFNWHGEVRVMKKCIQFMFERLGGFQCRQHSLRPAEEGKPEAERTQEEWDFGFDFIEKQGPRDHTRNRQLRWVTIQTTSKDSPIYRWHPTLVEKSLRNLSMDGVLAQVHTEWPLTLYDLDVRVLRALAPLFISVSEKADACRKMHRYGTFSIPHQADREDRRDRALVSSSVRV